MLLVWGRLQDNRAKILLFYFLHFTLLFFTTLLILFNNIIYWVPWGKLHRYCLTGSHHRAYDHLSTLQVTGCIFQNSWTGHNDMVAAPAASEETNLNGTIMPELDHKSFLLNLSHLLLRGVHYSKNIQKCKTNLKNNWASATHTNTHRTPKIAPVRVSPMLSGLLWAPVSS